MAIEQRELIQHQVAYRSPFEAFPKRHSHVTWQEAERYMQYQGTTGSLIDELAVALASPQEYFIRIALHPPRLIRAAIDWKINHPDSNGESFIPDAIQVGLAVYQRKFAAVALLQDFRHRIVATYPEMLTAAVEQAADFVTWDASNPDKSYESARKLAFKLEGQDILFIALGHGGIAAGMDVFLRYAAIAPSANSAFYAIRFSRTKMEDLEPRVSEVETAYLRELALGRQIVIFDEDSSSHTTLNGAVCYFRIETFPDRDITVCENLRSGEGSPNLLQNFDYPNLKMFNLPKPKIVFQNLYDFPSKSLHNPNK